MSDIWSDASFLQAACQIELAWVQAAAEYGFAPASVVEELQTRVAAVIAAPSDLLSETRHVGRPIAPLVDALAKGASLELQKVLHLGLTTQDVVDGAFVLMRRDASEICDVVLTDLIDQVRIQSDKHAQTLMPARSNGQIAGVTTFGLYLAEFAAELSRGRTRIASRQAATNHLSLSGPVGLSTPFGEKTQDIRHLAAQILTLAHDPNRHGAARDDIADLHLSLALLAKTLGRMAQTVLTLQSEGIGELSENDPGSSSAIPQKANPRRAEEVVTLTDHIDGQVLQALSATQTRHHRSGETWQQEWWASINVYTTLCASLKSTHAMFAQLEVNTEGMVRNITGIGVRAFADRLMVDLSSKVGRTDAKQLLSQVDLAALTFGNAVPQSLIAQTSNWNVEQSEDTNSLTVILALAEQMRATVIANV